MCGRYGLSVGSADLARAYHAVGDDIAGWSPQYSIAPSTVVPILVPRPEGDGSADPPGTRALEPARWGFRPSWAARSGPRPINARLETVSTNGLFRTAFRSHRAVVPMTGYYEWTPGPGRTKIPHWIHADGRLLSAAAVTADSPDDGLRTVAIVTTTGSDRAGEIHDRMPVFLADEALDEWLQPGRLDPTGAEGLVHLAAEQARRIAGRLDSRQVDPRVNSVRRIDPADPSLIDPVPTLF